MCLSVKSGFRGRKPDRQYHCSLCAVLCNRHPSLFIPLAIIQLPFDPHVSMPCRLSLDAQLLPFPSPTQRSCCCSEGWLRPPSCSTYQSLHLRFPCWNWPEATALLSQLWTDTWSSAALRIRHDMLQGEESHLLHDTSSRSAHSCTCMGVRSQAAWGCRMTLKNFLGSIAVRVTLSSVIPPLVTSPGLGSGSATVLVSDLSWPLARKSFKDPDKNYRLVSLCALILDRNNRATAWKRSKDKCTDDIVIPTMIHMQQ